MGDRQSGGQGQYWEWPIRQSLYNLTDQAALKVVGQVISQRCLETGVNEVVLLIDKEEEQKDKMIKFISVIEESGISLKEPIEMRPLNKHIVHKHSLQKPSVKPWTVLEEAKANE